MSKCPAHQDIEGAKHYDVIKGENAAKNVAYSLALSKLGSKIGENKTDESGNTSFGLKEGIAFNYGFSGDAPDRVLRVSFSGAGLTTGDRTALQSEIDAKIGSGKVVVE